MIKHIPYASLGHADHGWLNTRHHFSFADYYHPQRMGFGALRVVNDDIIQAQTGFDSHPHRNMEIISYVRQGAITHTDSQGNTGRTAAGDVQVMSAGRGIWHSEYNLENENTVLYQIWIETNKNAVEPRWAQSKFPQQAVQKRLNLLVSGDADEVLSIHQQAEIYGGRLPAGRQIVHPIRNQAYLLLSAGRVAINGTPLAKGDAAEITELTEATLKATTDAELIVIDVPASHKST